MDPTARPDFGPTSSKAVSLRINRRMDSNSDQKINNKNVLLSFLLILMKTCQNADISLASCVSQNARCNVTVDKVVVNLICMNQSFNDEVKRERRPGRGGDRLLLMSNGLPAARHAVTVSSR
jgi:hypothetical protein